MKPKSIQTERQKLDTRAERPPLLKAARIGVVSRDYSRRFKNGHRDFSNALSGVLQILDRNGCDVALFSLFTLLQRNSSRSFGVMRHVRAVMYEEFTDGKKRHAQRYVVAHRMGSIWTEYEFKQVFGTLKGSEHKLANFVHDEMPRRFLGNCCVLLCGETNGVKYSPKDTSVHDAFGLRKAIPAKVRIILNPVHDRMTRFEMKLKRRFLSENGRLVVSVWNKGKKDKSGRIKDGLKPAWSAFFNGEEKEIQSIPNALGVEIGLVDLK
jgi:hypothetical protein